MQGKGFRAAKYLRAGMLVLSLQQPVEVTAVQELETPRTVYNFEVENTHTYFVGSSALWVHNQCNYDARVKFRGLLPGRPNSDFLGHVIRGEGLGYTGISGAHNIREFVKFRDSGIVQIVSRTPHPSLPGVEFIRYKARNFLNGQMQPGFNQTIRPKTVYNPAYFSDADHVRWVYEARQYALANSATRINGAYWSGVTRSGIKMEGYATPNGEVITGYVQRW